MKNLSASIVVLLLFIMVVPLPLLGQLKVGNNVSTISNASLLELESTNKGLVFPRVILSNVNSYAPLASDILEGTVVYNTNTAITGGKGTGLYIWTGSAWLAMPTSNSSWGTNGNAGTDPATHFIGTTDNQPLRFRINNENAGMLHRDHGITYLGHGAGSGANTGQRHLAMGSHALSKNTTASNNTALGFASMMNTTTGGANIAIGSNSMLSNTSGEKNTSVGGNVLYNNTSGYENTAIGLESMFSNIDGYRNVALGLASLYHNTSGGTNTGIGYNSLATNTTGTDNTGLGRATDVGSANLTNATAVGAYARADASNTLILGSIAGTNGAAASTNVGIGTTAPTERLEVAGRTKTTTLQITNGATAGYVLTSNASGVASWAAASNSAWGIGGNAGTDTVTHFIGTTDDESLRFKINNEHAGLLNKNGNLTYFGYLAGNEANTGSRLVAIGTQALKDNTIGSQNVAVGSYSLASNTTGQWNTAVGDNTLASSNFTSGNTAVGRSALQRATTGGLNTAIGLTAMVNTTLGGNNTAVGTYSLYDNTDGGSNTAVGLSSMIRNTTGSSNTALGISSLRTNTTGANNTAIGSSSLFTNSTGSFNTGLGRHADVGSDGLSNATAIGANARADASNSLVLGSIAGINSATVSTNVGIGTTIPTARLDIGAYGSNTSLLLRNGEGSAGTASQQIAFGYNNSNQYMHAIKTRHNGSAMANNAIDFYIWNQGTDALGTVGTKRVMTIDGNGTGAVGIGTAAPTEKLEVVGRIKTTTLQVTTSPTAGHVLTSDASGIASWAAPVSIAASNGLGLAGNTAKLGGNLTENTVIEAGGTGYSFSVTGNNYNLAVVADQVSNGVADFYSGNTVNWQSFTCSKSGLLDHIDVSVRTSSSANYQYVVRIYSGTGIGGTLLNTTVVNHATGPSIFMLSFPVSTKLLLTSGQVYTFSLTIPSGVSIPMSANNPYTGGITDTPPNNDYFFTTYMQEYVNVSGLLVKDGNAGIGITSPQARLDIGQHSGGSSLLVRNGNGGTATTNHQLAFGYNGAAEYMHAIKTRHNGGAPANNAIDFYVWNQGTDAVGTVGSKKVMTIDGAGSSSTGTVEVNGHVRQQAYNQPITVSGNSTNSYTWTHNLGYQPIIMVSLDQTGGTLMNYCTFSYTHLNDNQLAIYLSNRHPDAASGRIRWIVVY